MAVLPALLVSAVSLFSTLIVIKVLTPRLKNQKITGTDVHKPSKPEIPEMGGLAIAAGFNVGIFLAISLSSFTGLVSVDLSLGYAAFTITLLSLLGVVDDILGMQQWTKAFIPALAAVPLMAMKAGQTSMNLPFLGSVEFGVLYPLILIPFGVTGASNAVNMLAGFNGIEVGFGLIMVTSLGTVAYTIGANTSFLILVSAFGAFIIVLYYNWYPARILIGDVGTFAIGAIIASAVILGNFESAGIILFIPYFLDFFIKLPSGFPRSFGQYRNGKVYCPQKRPQSLCHLIMKITGGITERNLTLTMLGLESIFAAIAVLLYARF